MLSARRLIIRREWSFGAVARYKYRNSWKGSVSRVGVHKMIYLRFVLVFALLQFSINTVTAQDLDLVVPVLVGQTGASASFGPNETDAYTMAAEEWNARGGVDGKRVVLSLEDTTTSAKQILSAFHLHASRGVKVILGPTWLDGFPAVIPVARKTGVLLVTPSAAIEAFSASDRTWPVTF